jgi:hypothetical protein
MTVTQDRVNRNELIDAAEDAEAILDGIDSGDFDFSTLLQALLLDPLDAIDMEIAERYQESSPSKPRPRRAPAAYGRMASPSSPRTRRRASKFVSRWGPARAGCRPA